MSAAFAVLPMVWASQAPPAVVQPATPSRLASTSPVEPNPAFYRKYTEAMLRRYLRFSMEAGRVPSLIGQEMFRARVTSYRVHSFEDLVIFVHDVEKCLSRLQKIDQKLLMRIAVQEYTFDEIAERWKLPRQTVMYRYARATDRLTEIFLETRMLEPLKACQEGGN